MLPTKGVMSSRKSLILVCIFSKANYNDSDGGILFGRWTETYPKNCTPPTAWTGSTALLEKFWKKKFYVKYGQCWVFSGLVTTCKSLNKRKCVRTVSNRREFQYVSIAFMIYVHHWFNTFNCVFLVLRSLGLPTRSVTNFQSAHDTDGSMTIDFHYDEEGNPLDDMDDSIW